MANSRCVGLNFQKSLSDSVKCMPVVSMPLLKFSAIIFSIKHASYSLVLLPELFPILGILNIFSEVIFI